MKQVFVVILFISTSLAGSPICQAQNIESSTSEQQTPLAGLELKEVRDLLLANYSEYLNLRDLKESFSDYKLYAERIPNSGLIMAVRWHSPSENVGNRTERGHIVHTATAVILRERRNHKLRFIVELPFAFSDHNELSIFRPYLPQLRSRESFAVLKFAQGLLNSYEVRRAETVRARDVIKNREILNALIRFDDHAIWLWSSDYNPACVLRLRERD